MTDDPDRPRFRSGTVARMARMPATTLRIWERRYAVSRSLRAVTGHRLYSQRELERVVLLRQLVSAGHAIGSIAGLDDDALRTLAAGGPRGTSERPMPLSIAAVGPAWKVPAAQAQAVRWTTYPTLASARAEATFVPVDLLLLREPHLDSAIARDLLELADRGRVTCVAVLYAFGERLALDVLRMAGVQLLRERGGALASDEVVGRVGRWMRRRPGPDGRVWGRAQRRYDADQLAGIARMSVLLACECPRHLAEIAARLEEFVNYSDLCSSNSPEDALMHRYLGDVSSRARELFEQALEHFVAVERQRLEQAERVASATSPTR